MENKPLVSVLMTSYNRQKYIAEAIESVIASTYQDFELIIVDDNSTDKTFSIAKEYAAKDDRIVVYVNENNLGQFANRNFAAEYAKGKYIKYVDSDDTVLPNAIAVMVAGMEKNPSAGIGLVNDYLAGKNENKIQYKLVSSEDAFLLHYSEVGLLFPGPTGGIFVTEYFWKAGGFPLDLGINGDIYLNMSIAKISDVVVFPLKLMLWRIHNEQVDQLQQNFFQMHTERFAINKKILSGKNIPLKNVDLRRIKLATKVLYTRGAIRNYLLKGKLKLFRAVMQRADVSLFYMVTSVLPLRVINSSKKIKDLGVGES